MRIIVSVFLLGIWMLTSIALPATAIESRWSKERVYHKEHHQQSKKCASDIIYDLTVPWPFRHARAKAVDSDMDGVVDRIDQCPNTPRGAVVDSQGCPKDSDGDGVYDGIDRCPDTPSGARVDPKGCPKDSDGDGVYDGIDRCENTPGGAVVDSQGCPKDSDGDGVYDGIDRCPNTPSGTEVDDHGCPVEIGETESQLLDTGMIRTSNILFETGKADLKPESRKILDEIGGVLVQWPELEIEISGHTDSQGSDDFNQKLSERRADAVRDYLVTRFPKIRSRNLTIAGYGEGKPIASNDTAKGRAQNRRVEFKVLNEDELRRAIERRQRRN